MLAVLLTKHKNQVEHVELFTEFLCINQKSFQVTMAFRNVEEKNCINDVTCI